jgi:hypothetical protein
MAVLAAAWAMTPVLLAQDYSYTPSYAPAPPVSPQLEPVTYSADQLDQMLAPIALYPDPLLSEVLAAATYPQDVAAAGQFLQYNPTPSDADISAQNWDPSVMAIAHYPTVVQMMAGQMDWTEALGNAFANQQQDVMDSVQRLRAQAQSVQTLASTPQQQVVQDDGVIEILPAQPDVIYVPQYDPLVVYSPPPYAGSWITFGPACPVGLWLDLGWDWHRHFINRGVRWGRDWRHPDFGRSSRWEHDRRRPIPPPRHPFVPPRNDGRRGTGRGWENSGRAPGAFNPGGRNDGRGANRPQVPQSPGQPNQPNRPNRPNESNRPERPNQPQRPERPVTGLPARPRATPEPPRPSTPSPAPPRPVQPARPAPRPAAPRPTPAPAPPRVERPVTGLPHRSAPPQRPAPAAPAPSPRPAAPARPAPAPSPVFRPGGGDGGGGASNRGHGSMRR